MSRRGVQQEATYAVGGRLLQVVKELGEGGFATVYAVQDVETKEPYALKRMVTVDGLHQGLAEKEISLLQTLRHPNIVDLIGHACNPLARGTEYLIQMELCTGGTLLEHILKRGQRRWAESEIVSVFSQVCCAIEVLHSQSPPIAHRDLKTENILLSRSGRWKLIDFGSCTTRAKKYTTTQEMHEEEQQIQKYSTPMYRAPEMADLYQKQLINEKVDIWALGCILYCMLFLVHPFQEGGSLVILNGCPPLPEHSYSQYPQQMLKRLFSVRVSKRPSISLVLEYCKKWKKFLDGTGDPEPDFSSHRSRSMRRSKSRKAGDRKKSSRRAKAESKAPVDSRARSRTTGAAPNRQAESESDSLSDSEDDSHKVEQKKNTAPPPPAQGKAADPFDFQWVADWKPFDEAHSAPSVQPTNTASTSVPDLLWFSDTPAQPVVQPAPRAAPPPPASRAVQTAMPLGFTSASQAYQQALLSPQPSFASQTGVGAPYYYPTPPLGYVSQPSYPPQYPPNSFGAPTQPMQQFQYGVAPTPYQQSFGQPRAAPVRPILDLPQPMVRRQTAPPVPQVSQRSTPSNLPASPSQAELDFDLAFR